MSFNVGLVLFEVLTRKSSSIRLVSVSGKMERSLMLLCLLIHLIGGGVSSIVVGSPTPQRLSTPTERATTPLDADNEECNGGECSTKSQQISISEPDHAWTAWSDWSDCLCRDGTRTRTRTCQDTSSKPSALCHGLEKENKSCSCEGLLIVDRHGSPVLHELVIDLDTENRVILFCLHSDHGSKHVKWIRDGVDFPSHSVEKPAKSRRLRIRPFRSADAGRYSCVYSEGDVIIEEKFVLLILKDSGVSVEVTQITVSESTTARNENKTTEAFHTERGTPSQIGPTAKVTEMGSRAHSNTSAVPTKAAKETPSHADSVTKITKKGGVLTTTPSSTSIPPSKAVEKTSLSTVQITEKGGVLTNSTPTLPIKATGRDTLTEASPTSSGEAEEISEISSSAATPTTDVSTTMESLKEITASFSVNSTSTPSNFPRLHYIPSGDPAASGSGLLDDAVLSGTIKPDQTNWIIPVAVTLGITLIVCIFVVVLRFHLKGKKPIQSSEENPYRPNYDSPHSPERKLAYRMRIRLEAPTPPVVMTSPAGPDAGVVVYGSLGVSTSLNAGDKGSARLSYVDSFGHTREDSPPDERASPEGHEKDGEEAAEVDLPEENGKNLENVESNPDKDDYADLDMSALQVGLPRPPPAETTDYAEIAFTTGQNIAQNPEQ